MNRIAAGYTERYFTYKAAVVSTAKNQAILIYFSWNHYGGMSILLS